MIRSSTEWVDNVSVKAVEDTLQSNGFWTTLLTGYRVTRVIEVKQRFQSMGKSLGLRAEKPPAAEGNLAHLADVLDFKSKNAQYEVLEKTKTAKTTKFQLKTAVCESSCSTMDSVCSER
ncbi:unnamed protein product [Peronospora farinosa]|uniref:Uncharacterized protein n=1 Tax=Peronospora farinosa TaxID=134698 RepID=A0AAV0SQR5_9STRA|nr:unnamed protein product [Peronospora farinosa]